MLAMQIPRCLGFRMTAQLSRRILFTAFSCLATILCVAATAGAQAAEPDSERTDSASTPSDESKLQLRGVVIEDTLFAESVDESDENSIAFEPTIVICNHCGEDCGEPCDDGCEEKSAGPIVSFGDWIGYNPAQSNTTWLAGDNFGMFSIESFPTLEFGKDSAVLFGSGFHFLNGPAGTGIDAPDMPPRLFDLHTAFHVRKQFNDRAMLDVKLGVGVFTDFEGSARKGVRFPGHVVGYNELTRTLVSVMGLEVLDRDDISVLPVGGLVWSPHRDLIFEAVFPRPRISMRLDDESAMYFGGELGGGTWAIQRDNTTNDNVTYRDLRVVWGIEKYGKGSDSTIEIGWAFDRSLEYRSGLGNTHFDGAIILRWHTHF